MNNKTELLNQLKCLKIKCWNEKRILDTTKTKLTIHTQSVKKFPLQKKHHINIPLLSKVYLKAS